jgi:hypothetical protein
MIDLSGALRAVKKTTQGGTLQAPVEEKGENRNQSSGGKSMPLMGFEPASIR